MKYTCPFCGTPNDYYAYSCEQCEGRADLKEGEE